jgi:hypothetical protein
MILQPGPSEGGVFESDAAALVNIREMCEAWLSFDEAAEATGLSYEMNWRGAAQARVRLILESTYRVKRD